jgi:hypothetical protein
MSYFSESDKESLASSSLASLIDDAIEFKDAKDIDDVRILFNNELFKDIILKYQSYEFRHGSKYRAWFLEAVKKTIK